MEHSRVSYSEIQGSYPTQDSLAPRDKINPRERTDCASLAALSKRQSQISDKVFRLLKSVAIYLILLFVSFRKKASGV